MANKEPQLAIDTLKKAVDANPSDIALRGDLANVYSIQKDLDSAIGQLEEILKLQPNNQQAFEAIFKIRVFQKDWAKAHAIADRLNRHLIRLARSRGAGNVFVKLMFDVSEVAEKCILS